MEPREDGEQRQPLLLLLEPWVLLAIGLLVLSVGLVAPNLGLLGQLIDPDTPTASPSGDSDTAGTDTRSYEIAIGAAKPVEEVMPLDDEEMDPLFIPVIPYERLMPNVLNLKAAKASTAIRDIGLSVQTKVGPSTTDVARGSIYYQDPPPGTEVVLGQTATLWVSSGPFDITEGEYTGFPYPRPPEE